MSRSFSISSRASRDNVRHIEHVKNEEPLKTHLRGLAVLNSSILNKGAAFPREERKALQLEGLLPYEVHTLDQQCARVQAQLEGNKNPVDQYAFLASLKDQNQTLFYNFVLRHLKKLMPIIYTPTAGEAIQRYSHLFRRPVGCFLAYPDMDDMEGILAQFGDADDIDIVVVTDGEAILGIGDQGAGGIAISIAKAQLYSLAGGLNPARILPVMLDVGTNRQDLLDDPLYLGWKNKRLTGEEYDRFVDKFCGSIAKMYPNALLHFEDFGVSNALRLLEKYQPKQSVFNDDFQGTSCIASAALTAAIFVTKTKLSDQRFVIYGSGSAGIGIAEGILSSLVEKEGLTEEEATSKFWCLDRQGLLLENFDSLRSGQKRYARKVADVAAWPSRSGAKGDEQSGPGLLEVVQQVKPTVLIGCSTHKGAFTEEVIREMHKHVERPIIFPLSNPTTLVEATPQDITDWTDGLSLIATGSPFEPAKMPNGRLYEVSQCNNAEIFPGLGLGVVISKATKVTPGMLVAAIDAIAKLSPALHDPDAALLPDIGFVRHISVKVAQAVAAQARKEGVVQDSVKDDDRDWTEEEVRKWQWDPLYRPIQTLDDSHVKKTAKLEIGAAH
ncbi:uncharacterized protein L969DRAFT_625470 [Mixia osmundae IAM 14324]|uniref:Malic enzyme n=1 Tax=Mixia osmundae (strain CBS 9802 / IAM 14324 / JCM 22182 / KY 12970) TaxID=764103 RepID=G7E6V1_MIXOS|nr:uncharacterized protein L969DRAFT_625470 [Mixia osmundae IAM 14324]KEI39057.1 hypothetical protein L969DRAFT_625470 [Mixia osmundae IAM 14324]GAA98561.1 hypothetical protein E5Q_05248 [Mixia osmundae IAM 14324]